MSIISTSFYCHIIALAFRFQNFSIMIYRLFVKIMIASGNIFTSILFCLFFPQLNCSNCVLFHHLSSPIHLYNVCVMYRSLSVFYSSLPQIFAGRHKLSLFTRIVHDLRQGVTHVLRLQWLSFCNTETYGYLWNYKLKKLNDLYCSVPYRSVFPFHHQELEALYTTKARAIYST